MNMKTDVEIIRELVDLYKNETIGAEQKLNILTDLEYYVHQVGKDASFSFKMCHEMT